MNILLYMDNQIKQAINLREQLVQGVACPVCQSYSITTFLTRNRVPVHQHLIMESQKLAREINRGKLELVVCEDCGFIFNQSFEPSKLNYSDSYDNSQTCSTFFEEYLSGLVRYLILERNVRNCRIVEVGCGKGWFLRKLVEFEGAGNRGYGFDPSYIGQTIDIEGRLRFEKSYYGPEYAEVPADVVICRHVIEHVPDPLSLLRTIRQTVINSPHARIFFETPCVEWILRNQVIWDFFYEHCSYFTAESLRTAFEISNLKVESVHHVFGGQYLWLEARVSDEKLSVTKCAGSIPALARQFAKSEDMMINSLRARVQGIADKEKVALWGAGAKGVTLANLIDPECKWITCVVDLNPKKQGHYLPGTGHPIVGYHELEKYGINVAILMNPNYRDENLALIRESGLKLNLIDLAE